jgi:hypothetical protein
MLFDINSYCKGLPPRTTIFASDANRASEIRAFQRLGIPVGVSVGELNEEAITTLLASCHSRERILSITASLLRLATGTVSR